MTDYRQYLNTADKSYVAIVAVQRESQWGHRPAQLLHAR